jgi:hypothetical protein
MLEIIWKDNTQNVALFAIEPVGILKNTEKPIRGAYMQELCPPECLIYLLSFVGGN